MDVRRKVRATQVSENCGINLMSLGVLEVYRKGANVTGRAYSPWTEAVWTGSWRAEHWPASILKVSKEQSTGLCKSMSSLRSTLREADTSTHYTCSLLSERICKAEPNPAGTLTSIVAWVMQGPTALTSVTSPDTQVSCGAPQYGVSPNRTDSAPFSVSSHMC